MAGKVAAVALFVLLLLACLLYDRLKWRRQQPQQPFDEKDPLFRR